MLVMQKNVPAVRLITTHLVTIIASITAIYHSSVQVLCAVLSTVKRVPPHLATVPWYGSTEAQIYIFRSYEGLYLPW